MLAAVGGLAGDVVAADQQLDGHRSGEHGHHGTQGREEPCGSELEKAKEKGWGMGKLEVVRVHFRFL